ncbi:hypothetical protein JMJ35_009966 [Cladonia borealis]|uniref:Heterokaryon incompatibility domain-containing protein n=1 Tax=Cladonia borealis TaxID=184061 RepID=A0AA39QTH8_9LECA|nr:hypothetical protein JMJ35_009966 [Cladonia borealis]
MRLLKREGPGDFRLTPKLSDKNIPPYAILSHTWGGDEDEVTFEDLEQGIGRNKTGFQKIEFCGEQAARDKLEYFWVDTCCIKKTSDAEVAFSLNSMFRWYHNATKCYVYLSDFSARIEENLREAAFRNSRWFTRGWTLPELLAPESVEFFSKEGILLGSKVSLKEYIMDITGIPVQAFLGDFRMYSSQERISWINGRETEAKEDIIYCLLGICDVFMPIIYGEGEENALRRLQQEISSLQRNKDKGEESYSKYLEARARDGACWNCGSRDHWESQCRRPLCGKCEGFSKR